MSLRTDFFDSIDPQLIRPYTKDEYAEMVMRLKKAIADKDKDAEIAIRHEVILRTTKMIFHFGKSYKGVDPDELVGAGVVALTEAVMNWNPNKGTLFGWVEKYLTSRLTRAKDGSRMIKISAKVSKGAALVLRRLNEAESLLGRDLTLSERKEIIGNDLAFEDLPRVNDSLDRVIGFEENRDITVGDRIEASTGDPYKEVEVGIIGEAVHEAVGELSEIEQDVIISRFGLNGAKRLTLNQLGKKYNYTVQAMRRIEATAIAKMRHPAALSDLMQY